jgi:PAS domain-containing protein
MILSNQNNAKKLPQNDLVTCHSTDNVDARPVCFVAISPTANVERNSDGVPARMVGIFMDITDQKHTQIELENQEHRFEALIRNGFDGSAILKHDRAMIYLSPASESILGWTNDDTVTRTRANG